MANPFLVLGGVAVGVVTAGIGVLAVPGWINSAQDANSIQDLSLISDAQSARLTNDGAYAPTLAALENAQGVKVKTSADTRVYSAASPDGSHWAAVSRSKTGTYFARLSQASKVGQGTSIEQAITNAGTTITGPAGARVTAQGVPVPAPYELADIIFTNLHRNPGAVNAEGYYSWAGTSGSNSTSLGVTTADWSLSGRAFRTTWNAAKVNNGDFSVRFGAYVPAGEDVTVRYRFVAGTTIRLSPIRLWSIPAGVTIVDSSHPETSTAQAGEIVEVWATIRIAPGAEITNNSRVGFDLGNHVAGTTVDISDADIYVGQYDASRPWFHPDAAAPQGFAAGWRGSDGTSVLFK